MQVKVEFEEKLPQLERKQKIAFFNEDETVQEELEFSNPLIYSSVNSYIFDFDIRGYLGKTYVKQFTHALINGSKVKISQIKKYL